LRLCTSMSDKHQADAVVSVQTATSQPLERPVSCIIAAYYSCDISDPARSNIAVLIHEHLRYCTHA